MRLDLLAVLRGLRKDPLFTIATVVILALGIGANTAVFSVVDAVLLRASPYAAADRLVRIEEAESTRSPGNVDVRCYQRWSGRTDVFEKIAPYIRDTVTITGDGEPEQVTGLRTIGLFPLLGIPARLGRTLVAADDIDGAPNVVVISGRLWRRRYHADPAVIGRTITVSDEAFVVAGVMPPDFEFRYADAELWTSLRITPASPWLQVVARLRPGVSAAQAQSALAIAARQIEQESPKEHAGLKFLVTPWRDTPDEKYRLTLLFVLAAFGLMMLIACADAGSLLLSRAVQRQKEIAIRASLGAGLWRIVRQLLAEGLVLAVLGSVAGIGLARALLQLLTRQLAALPVVLPHLTRVALDGRVLAFHAALCVLLAILCSLAPILLAARTNLESVLRGGQSTATAGSSRLFSTLVAVEAGLAFLLLVGSGLMVRSLIHLQQEDHGFHPDHVLTLRVPVGAMTPGRAGRHATRPQQMAYYREILERVRTAPGIKAVAIANNLPLSGVNSSLALHIKGSGGKEEPITGRTVSPQYFAAMGIPLLAGRDFTDADRTGSPGVAIVNQYLARQLYPDRNAVGEKLAEDPNSGTIVGVVKDSSQLSYELPAKAEVYVPYQQFYFAAFMSAIVVRTEGDPLALANALKQKVWEVDPKQPVVKVETMDDVIANSIWRPRFSAWIFSVLSGLSVLLTAIGIYAVVAYTSAMRAREVGIRVALGAVPRQVVAVILRGAMVPLTIGIALSVVAALLLSRLLTSLLYGISASDPVTYCGAAALLVVIGAAASLRPAWCAATRDPLATLRAE